MPRGARDSGTGIKYQVCEKEPIEESGKVNKIPLT